MAAAVRAKRPLCPSWALVILMVISATLVGFSVGVYVGWESKPTIAKEVGEEELQAIDYAISWWRDEIREAQKE